MAIQMNFIMCYERGSQLRELWLLYNVMQAAYDSIDHRMQIQDFSKRTLQSHFSSAMQSKTTAK